MTDDRSPDPDELDELVSAALDAEASAGERARVDGNPGLAARLDELRGIAEQVGSVEPLTDDRRESLIATALTAARDLDAVPHDSPLADAPAPTPVATLAAHRRSKRPLAFSVGVAAAVIAILAVPALLIGLNRDSGTRNMAVATADGSSSDESAAFSPVGGAIPDDPSSTTAARDPSQPADDDQDALAKGPPVPLGSASSTDELHANVKQQLASPADASDHASPSTTAGSVATTTVLTGPPLAPELFNSSCADQIRTAVPDLGPLILSGTIQYQGVARQVYGFGDDPGGPVTAIVVDPATCAIVAQTTVHPD